MAQKRMFTKSIIDSDPFLEMPLSAQALYFHLNMRADDDGFVNNPKRITNYVSASADDLKILLAKRFIIRFDSGVIVIKHWRMHNTLKSDRYRPTVYQDELARLSVKPNKAYTESLAETEETPALPEPNRNQYGTILEPQYSIGKDSIGLDQDSTEEEASNDASCAEPETVSTPPVIDIILNDGSYYGVTNEDVIKWTELYPAVDVMQELRNMAGWCDANPKKRKTKSGIRRFINGWLSGEQNKGGTAYRTQGNRAQGNRANGNIFAQLAEDLRNEQS